MTLSATGFGPLLFLDLAAGFMLAAAASCLARTGGARAGGALALACLAGLAPPLLRDALLGMPLLALDQPACLAATLAGGAARSCRSGRLFFLADAFGLALATGLAAAKSAALGLEATGALILGLGVGLAGSLVRDILQGNTALALEEDLYATAAALGAAVSLVLVRQVHLPPWQCALGGAACILLLRAFRLRRW